MAKAISSPGFAVHALGLSRRHEFFSSHFRSVRNRRTRLGAEARLARSRAESVEWMRSILVRYRIAPHRWRHSEISTDPKFEEKVCKVAGLHINPSKQAVVLSINEETQIQAIRRTNKSLPMKPGQPATITHDCKRHGTTTLFAALNTLNGKAFGRNSERHRHQEFIKFLAQVKAGYSPDRTSTPP